MFYLGFGMLSSMARPNQVWVVGEAELLTERSYKLLPGLAGCEFGYLSIVTIVGHGQCWVSNLLQETSETQGQPSQAVCRWPSTLR